MLDKTARGIQLPAVKQLLDGFVSAEGPCLEGEKKGLDTLLTGFAEKRQERLLSQRATAEDIDFLSLTGFEADENTHSDFLGFFLDREESHAQRNLFFRLFLGEVGLPAAYAETDYAVQREVSVSLPGGETSRIDIEACCPGEDGFLIHVENKVGDEPTKRQFAKENAALQIRGKQLRVPRGRLHGFLLSPRDADKVVPRGRFGFVHWRQVADLLIRFAQESGVPRVGFAVEQYLKCVRRGALSGQGEETPSTTGGRDEDRLG